MFCNFCGKNFDTSEGFEEVTRSGHHYVRCEKCTYENQEVEYDWSAVMYGRFSKDSAGNTTPSSTGGQGGRFQQRGSGGRSAAAGSSKNS
jgi:hypothetical protein